MKSLVTKTSSVSSSSTPPTTRSARTTKRTPPPTPPPPKSGPIRCWLARKGPVLADAVARTPEPARVHAQQLLLPDRERVLPDVHEISVIWEDCNLFYDLFGKFGEILLESSGRTG